MKRNIDRKRILPIAPHDYEMCNNELYSLIQKEFKILQTYLSSLVSSKLTNICFNTFLSDESRIYLNKQEINEEETYTMFDRMCNYY